MNNFCRMLTISVVIVMGVVFALQADIVTAQVPDIDLLHPMLPSRPTVAVPGGGTTPPAPMPTTPLGVLPGHTVTPLPDPGFATLPPAPEPSPQSD